MYARKSFLFALLALLLAMLACSGPGDLMGPQAPETWEYDPNLGLGDDVESYTAAFKVDLTGADSTGVDVELGFDGDIEAQRDPATSSLNVSTSVSAGGESMSANEEAVFIDDTYYEAGNASGSQECYGTYDEDDVPFTFGELLDYAEMEGIQDFFKELPDLDYVGDEDLDGASTWHYQGEGDVDIEGGEMQDVVVDVWIEPATGHVLRLELAGSFSDAEAEGEMTMSYDLTSVNEGVDIEAPSVCD